MSDLQERLARLSPEQRALVAKRLKIAQNEPRKILRRPEGIRIPLSYPQERLWFMEELFPDLPVNNIVGVVTVRGRFDNELYYRALKAVVDRHESLRTAILAEEGHPYQEVRDSFEPERLEYDLTNLPESERKIRSDALVSELSLRVFPLSEGCLIRSAVLRHSQNEHRILVVMHHIAADGWSTSILLCEVLAVQKGLLENRAAELRPLEIQYPDFAYWKRQKDEEAFIGKHLEYWEKNLQPLPPHLDLPTDKVRPTTPTHRGGRVFVAIPDERTESLKERANTLNVTPFMLLLATYALVLHRYSQQEDFAIGVPVASRDRQELEGLIGCFINLLTLRIDASGEPTFRDFLKRIAQVSLSAFEHAVVPFETIVSQVNPGRETSSAPLFQVAFSFEREPTEGLENDPDLTMQFEEVSLGISRYDLSLELTLGQNGLAGWIDYSSDLFERETVERFVEHFLIALQDVLENPDLPIGKTRLLSEKELHTVLYDWNRTTTEYPRDASVPELFSICAKATPDKLALQEADVTMTYAELDAASGILARRLSREGFGPDSVVALCCHRSIEAVVAILGILKSGAAYVPIDSAQPQSRIDHILNETSTQKLIVDAANLERFGNLTEISVSPVSALLAEPSAQERKNFSVRPNDRAYIMYTSGSTGTPKGVAVTHRNIVRLVQNTNYAHFGPDEVGLLFAPLAFDASTFEIWGPLLNGGTLAIAPPGPFGFDQLSKLLKKQKVTTLWLTAGLFQSMVQENVEGLTSLRQLLSGGDVLPEAQVAKFVQAAPECRFINGYGPTEGTTFTCCHTVTPDDLGRGSIPIGRPISNTTVYILDRLGNPVPIGVPGELYVGGDGVALGYFRRDDLTAERFVNDPFSPRTDARLYKTGDRARFLPDGRIKFEGRLDNQVKLRGFRIELGEIETHLCQHPYVKEATVTLRKDERSGDGQLWAYLVLQNEASCEGASFRTYLKDRLPDYMIPTWYRALDRLPLSSNGKVDKHGSFRPSSVTKIRPGRLLWESRKKASPRPGKGSWASNASVETTIFSSSEGIRFASSNWSREFSVSA